ncbi:hypothetical protein KPL71_001337 [Citrus sinensis]|uniref:Uncharacterized protein n=1 Tax=Citrus sinensis TaxID=2711 RepID=A0ACB8NVR5_CITSI|nr:hypothetical protein KPL71_001337 [Citrus sinensis]
MCLNSNGRIYITTHVNFNESSFPLKKDLKFMNSKQNQLYKSLNSFSKFITVSFPSESHSHEATTASSNSSENPIKDVIHSDDQDSDNSHNQTTPVPNSVSNTHSETQNTSDYSVALENTEVQNQNPKMSQTTPKLNPSHPMITRAKAGIFKPKTYNIEKALSLETPSSVVEALSDKNWKLAMHDEFHALIKNQTWCLVPPEQNMKLVGNKWMFRVKQNSDGTINKYKARLVAKGFLQTEGVDYQETFSPVVKATTIRIVLSMAVMNNWKLRQVDINNAFLNGELTETVYMPQPEGFVDADHPRYVCKLKKALYGLK